MPTEWTTDAQQLADTRLGGRLREFVAERRQRFPQMSWRHIARELFDATGCDFSDQTLMNWFPEYRPRHISEGTPAERAS